MSGLPSLIRRVGVLSLLLAIFVSSGLAEVVILETEGHLEHWAFHPAGSHSPCSGATWNHEIDDGPTYYWSFVEDWGCLITNWTTYCYPDRLMYQGRIYKHLGGDYPLSGHFDAHLTCLIETSEPTVLVAHRSVGGNPISSEFNDQTVFLTHPDGSIDVLLDPDFEVNEAERQLGVGQYRITIELDVGYGHRPPYPFEYTETIQVAWDQPTENTGTSWGAMKALYR